MPAPTRLAPICIMVSLRMKNVLKNCQGFFFISCLLGIIFPKQFLSMMDGVDHPDELGRVASLIGKETLKFHKRQVTPAAQPDL